jgi:hypothetical protein
LVDVHAEEVSAHAVDALEPRRVIGVIDRRVLVARRLVDASSLREADVFQPRETPWQHVLGVALRVEPLQLQIDLLLGERHQPTKIPVTVTVWPIGGAT